MNEDLYSSVFDGTGTFLFTDWWGMWTPTPEEIYLNMSRLVERHFNS